MAGVFAEGFGIWGNEGYGPNLEGKLTMFAHWTSMEYSETFCE
jgi:hypothetical protein